MASAKPSRSGRRPHPRDELVRLGFDDRDLVAQGAKPIADQLALAAGGVGGRRDDAHRIVQQPHRTGRLVDRTRDLGGRGVLFLDRGGDGRPDIAQLGDDLGDLADLVGGAIGRGLNLLDLVLDVVGRPFRLRGEVLDLLRDDGETLARLAGPRRRGDAARVDATLERSLRI